MRTVKTIALSNRDWRALCRDLYRQSDSANHGMETFRQTLGSSSGAGGATVDSARHQTNGDTVSGTDRRDDGRDDFRECRDDPSYDAAERRDGFLYDTKQDLSGDTTLSKKAVAPSGPLYTDGQ